MDTVMAISGGAWLLLVVGTVLGLWALGMGFKGIMAEHPPFREGGHAPGAKGTYDPAYEATGKGRGLKAA